MQRQQWRLAHFFGKFIHLHSLILIIHCLLKSNNSFRFHSTKKTTIGISLLSKRTHFFLKIIYILHILNSSIVSFLSPFVLGFLPFASRKNGHRRVHFLPPSMDVRHMMVGFNRNLPASAPLFLLSFVSCCWGSPPTSCHWHWHKSVFIHWHKTMGDGSREPSSSSSSSSVNGFIPASCKLAKSIRCLPGTRLLCGRYLDFKYFIFLSFFCLGDQPKDFRSFFFAPASFSIWG